MIAPDLSLLKLNLPSTEELPCSDDTPVDNEDQNYLPNLLLFMLMGMWVDRMDWYFGVDMGVYHTTGVNPRVPVVPDGFLSLGVARQKGGKSRRSYATWEEQDIVPTFVLEMVSHKPGGEYEEKVEIYRNLGVLYYVIYNPEFWRRDNHHPFEVYKLIEGVYQLQIGEPYWMPEICLGLGRTQSLVGGIQREILCWYDETGNAYATPDEVQRQSAIDRYELRQAKRRAEAELQKNQQLSAYLRSIGIDPDNLPS
jgi:Uma2 family endonuclease